MLKCVHVCIYMYTYIHISIYIYTYIYIYIYDICICTEIATESFYVCVDMQKLYVRLHSCPHSALGISSAESQLCSTVRAVLLIQLPVPGLSYQGLLAGDRIPAERKGGIIGTLYKKAKRGLLGFRDIVWHTYVKGPSGILLNW